MAYGGGMPYDAGAANMAGASGPVVGTPVNSDGGPLPEGPAGNIGAPAVAHAGSELVVAWAARGGGVAVTVHP